MCRLMYFSRSPVESDRELLLSLFSYLERAQGGDGNGVGWYENGNGPAKVVKGPKTKVERLVDVVIEAGQPFIFHTRKATIGSINVKNTHPFIRNGVITCHNGHWHGYDDVALQLVIAGKLSAREVIDISDSEIIATLVGYYGFDVTRLIKRGVILSLYPQHAKVACWGSFQYAKMKDGTYIYASEFPSGLEAEEKKTFGSGTIATLRANGLEIHTGNVYAYSSSSIRYHSYYWPNAAYASYSLSHTPARESEDEKKPGSGENGENDDEMWAGWTRWL